jgi:transcription elongation factor GreA
MRGVPMTREGLERLQAELAELEGRRPRLLTAIREAREKGDLSENAEYHAAREDLALTEQRISSLKEKIGNAQLVDPARIGGDAVTFGATVRVLNLDDQEEEEFTLVGEGEADPFLNRILTTSPVGNALLTKKVGEVAEAPAPKGRLRFKILSIRFE